MDNIKKNIHDHDTQGTHICMPMLSLMVVFLLTFAKRRKRFTLYYEMLPRYLRGLSRFFKISPEKIIIILSTISGLTIQKIKYGDVVPDYPHVHLQAMETVTTITEQLIPELQSDPWMIQLEKLIGEKASVAYVAKYVSQYQLFTYTLPMVACYKSIRSPARYIVVWNSEWPNKWHEIVQSNLSSIKFEFFRWPKWYLFIERIVSKVSFLLILPIILFKYIIIRGLTFGTSPCKHFKLITEFIDPTRMNGTPYDTDYWIDGLNLKKNEVLFFLTRQQKQFLVKDGYSVKEVVKSFKFKGYEIELIDEMPYSINSVISFMYLYLKLISKMFFLDSFILSQVFLKAWIEYLEFLPLFLNFSSKNLIYLTLPNAKIGLKFNDAIVTGLCRKYGIKSVGCQTRTIYSRNFEYCFDCFDVYLSWGPMWYKTLGKGMQFVNKIEVVGCIYLDYLIPIFDKYLQTNAGQDTESPLTVTIFNSDISDDHNYTKNYAKSFLINCADLAAIFPNIKFLVKTKDPDYIQIMMDDADFYKAYVGVSRNFSFVNQSRYNYAEILTTSDIVIAIAYTTPGTEGLLLGKRAIYYSELGCGGQAFEYIPDFIANNSDELKRIFACALGDYKYYYIKNANYLDQLDPFRDDHVKERINNLLYSEIQGEDKSTKRGRRLN